MASKRDVELRIKAKNEASAAIDAVAKALNELTSVQKDLSQGAGRTGEVLSSLAKGFERFKGELAGLNVLSQVSKQIDAMTASIQKFEGALSEDVQKLAEYRKAHTDSVSSVRQLAQEARTANSAFAEQEQRYKDSTKDLKSLQREIQVTSNKVNELRITLKAKGGTDSVLASELIAQKAALDGLRQARSVVEASVAGQKKAFNDLAITARESAAALNLAKKNQESLAASASKTVSSIRSQKENLAALKTEQASAAGSADKLRAALSVAGTSQDQISAAIQRTVSELNKFQAAMDRQKSSSSALPKTASGFNNVAVSADRMATSVDRSSNSLARSLQLQRSALSITQRLRGQVLSLAAGYIGLFAAIQQISQVIGAFRTVEAAQNRLGAVFDQDTAKVQNEMRFLSAIADRLGQNFGVLAEEYSKFAVAGKQANVNLATTKTLFVSVAEAARVNKLTTEQTSGVFLALTQIMSKGKIQAEELTRQLGDRLPGATGILAKSLGVSTAELFDMLKAGELIANDDTLLKFADGLNQAFGKQLPTALKSTTTQLDRFGNIIFKARQRVANGGFIDQFTAALTRLNDQLQSPAASNFFLQVGAALGKFVGLIGVVVNNIGILVTSIQALVALRFAIVVGTWLPALKSVQGALAGVAFNAALGKKEFLGFAAGVLTSGLSKLPEILIAAGVSLLRLVRVFPAATAGAKGLGEALGLAGLKGAPLALLVGIIVRIAAAAAAFAGIDFLTKFLTGVDESVQRTSDLEDALQAIANAAEAAKGETDGFAASIKGVSETKLKDLVQGLVGDFVEASAKLDNVLTEFRGTQNFETLVQLRNDLLAGKITLDIFISKFNELAETDTGLKKAGAEIRDAARGLDESGKKAQQASDALKVMQGDAEATARAVKGLNDELDKVGDFKVDTSGFEEALSKLREGNKAGREFNKNLEEQNKIEAARKFITDPKTGKIVDEQRAALLEQTILLNSQEDARVKAEKAAKKAASEAARDAKQAAQNAANLRQAIADGVRQRQLDLDLLDKSSTEQKIVSEQERIRTQAARDGLTVRQQDLDLIRQQQQAIAQRSFELDVIEKIKDAQFELFSLSIEDERQREVAVAARKLELEALEKGVTLTAQQLSLYKDLVGQVFDAQNKRKAAEDAEKKVNELLELRKTLQERITFLQDQGTAGSAAEAETLNGKLKEVDATLKSTTDEAIRLAKILGDETLVQKLEIIKASIRASGEEARLTGKAVDDAFSGGAVSALDSFAEKIANGESAFSALRDSFLGFASDFLKKIAQMIAEAALFNALQSAFGGGQSLGSGIAGFINSFAFHDGGVVGSGGSQRFASPAWFAKAQRYHSGGIAGLKPNEVPAILQKNEEVLTESDPRHRANGGVASPANVKVVNTIDAGSFISQGLNSTEGEQAIMNFVRANQSSVRSALGV